MLSFTIDHFSCIFAALSCVLALVVPIKLYQKNLYDLRVEKVLDVIIKADIIIDNFLQFGENERSKIISDLICILGELAIVTKKLEKYKIPTIEKFVKYFSDLYLKIRNKWDKKKPYENHADIFNLLNFSGKKYDLSNEDVLKNLESLKMILEDLLN